MEINILEIEILKFLKENEHGIEDYVLYGREPHGIHIVQPIHDFPMRLVKKGIKPNPVEIEDALENLELEGRIHVEPVNIAMNDIRTNWKKCKITTEGKKYLRKIEQLTK